MCFLAIALFGSMLLAPLYYQGVRGENALHAGLLLAPQGIGAAIAMPLAGRLTDRVGAGRIVPFGILLALIGTLGFHSGRRRHAVRGEGELPPAVADKLAHAFGHTYCVAFGLISFAIVPSLLLPRRAVERAPGRALPAAEGAPESVA